MMRADLFLLQKLLLEKLKIRNNSSVQMKKSSYEDFIVIVRNNYVSLKKEYATRTNNEIQLKNFEKDWFSFIKQPKNIKKVIQYLPSNISFGRFIDQSEEYFYNVTGRGIELKHFDTYTISINCFGIKHFFKKYKTKIDEISERWEKEPPVSSKKKESHVEGKKSDSDLKKELTINIPKTYEEDILGREIELKEIHTRLLNNQKFQVIKSMGGLGKTALASTYLTKYYDSYGHIIWIDYLFDDFREALINAPGLLEKLQIDFQDSTLKQIFNKVIIELKQIQDIPCLMVIDSAKESLVEYYRELPSTPNWHILITTRYEMDDDNFEAKELKFLDEQDTITLFKKHYKKTELSYENLKEIVNSFDKHTLTIEILAKTANTHRNSLNQLLKAIETDLSVKVRTKHSENKKIDTIANYLKSIFKVIGLSEETIWVLKNLASLPSKFQKYSTLTTLIEPEQYQKINFAEELSNLVKKGGYIITTN